MSGNDDDEALTWAGGRDPSHYETPEAKPAKATKRPARQAPADVDAAETADEEAGEDEDDRPPAMSSVVLVCLGILGGIYALYTVGWFVSWQRLLYTDTDVLELAAFRAQQWLGIIAAPLWFVVTFVFTRGRKPALRLLLLVLGAILLVPWSFVFGQ